MRQSKAQTGECRPLAEENKARPRRSRAKPRRASLTANPDGPEGSQSRTPDEVTTLIETFTFKFKADRFGFKTSREKSDDEIAYARAALRALNRWAEVVGGLLGDIDDGLRVAGDARIMPYNPTWSSTYESRQRVGDNLGADADAQVGREIGRPYPSGELIDPKTRDAVEELRIYLRVLWTWHNTFEAGLWIATVASWGSVESDPRRRLLRGLVAIAAVCEFDAIDTPDRIFSELLAVAKYASGPDQNMGVRSAFTPAIASAIEGARALELQSSDFPTGFVEKPSLLYDWAERLSRQLTPHQHEDHLPAEQWDSIETDFWRQWYWPPSGAVVRHQLSGKMSVLDLMVAARYNGEIFLHWRGGLLSIAQWSRLLAVASRARLDIMREPAEAALGQLGFSEMIESYPPGSQRRPTRPPLVALSILASSPLLLWRPDPAIRAFALPPRERYETDLRIAHFGIDFVRSDPSRLLVKPEQSRLGEVVERCNQESGVAKLHLIEVSPHRGSDRMSDGLSEPARDLSWARVYFGSQPSGLGVARRSLRSSARSIRELVQEARGEFPELFPDEIAFGASRPYMILYRRFQRGRLYASIRRSAIFRWLERLFGMARQSGR